MSKISDFLATLALGTIETIGEEQLDIVLQDLHDSNVQDYNATIHGVQAGLNHLQPVVAKSKSKILVGIVNALAEEIAASAAKNGVVLDAVDDATDTTDTPETPTA